MESESYIRQLKSSVDFLCDSGIGWLLADTAGSAAPAARDLLYLFHGFGVNFYCSESRVYLVLCQQPLVVPC